MLKRVRKRERDMVGLVGMSLNNIAKMEYLADAICKSEGT